MATIQGSIWQDLNQNQGREVNEPGLSGWTLFLDQNRNGVLDNGETTTQTDNNGNYAFTDLIPGIYTVAQVEQSGWRSLLSSSSQIPFTGLAANGQGALAWNTFAGAPEPAREGHVYDVPGFPGVTFGSFYYLASRDYGGIDPNSPGAIQAEAIQGFPNLAAALAQHGYTPSDIKVKFGLTSLGDDIQGQDWFLTNENEFRYYQGGDIVFQLNGENLIGGSIPEFFLRVELSDLPNNPFPTYTGGIKNVVPSDLSSNSSAAAQQVAQALLTDLAGQSLNFQYLSLSFSGEEAFFDSGRLGILYEANAGNIHKAAEPLVQEDAYSVLLTGFNETVGGINFANASTTVGGTLTLEQADDYLASHGDLIIAFGYDLPAAIQHYEQFGRDEGRIIDDFAENAYLASHDDLLTALGNDPDAATRHYIQYGFAEGRQITFQADDYLASHGDLIEAFGYDLATATQHYLNYGAEEGRDRDRFDEVAYLNNYSDLQAAYGNDLEAATKHYIQFGYFEGRVA